MLPVGLGTGVLYTDEMIDMPPEVGDTRARGTEVIMFIIQKRRLQAFLAVRVRTRPQSGFRFFTGFVSDSHAYAAKAVSRVLSYESLRYHLTRPPARPRTETNERESAASMAVSHARVPPDGNGNESAALMAVSHAVSHAHKLRSPTRAAGVT